MSSTNQKTAGRLYLLPFFIFFTASSIALLNPDYENQSHKDSSIFNQITLSSAYFIAITLILKQQGFLTRILRRAIPFNILLFLTLTSLFWSSYPFKVCISFVHNTGMAFIALCMVILLTKDKNNFFKTLLITLFIYLVATIIVTHLRPDIGLMSSSNIYAISLIGRWKGLTTHPNSLGGICLFTTWIALSTFFYTSNRKWVSWLAGITVLAAFYCVYKANSMTSLLLSMALVFGMLWYAFIGTSTGGLKFLKIFFGFMALFIGMLFLYILHPEIFSEKYFFRAIGRDSALSGRASLWELGLQGFTEKPYFGWSYDNLRSFLKKYDMGYGQLHNGYLDLLVRGGLVSIFFFLLLVFQLFALLVKQASRKHKDYVFIFALALTALLHNMTESTIFTNTNLIWLMFLIGYFYCLGIDRPLTSSTPSSLRPPRLNRQVPSDHEIRQA